MLRSFLLSAARCAVILVIGGSVALGIISFWGPSVDYFDIQAWLFGLGAIAGSIAAMRAAAARIPSVQSAGRAGSIAAAISLLLAVPGVLAFVWLPRVDPWLWLAAVAVGPLLASLLFPAGRRRWIPLLWLASGILIAVSIPVSEMLTDPGANSSEGIGMLVVQALVWLGVLVAGGVIGGAVVPDSRSVSRSEQALQPDASSSVHNAGE